MMLLISHSLGRAVVLFWRQKRKQVDEEEVFFYFHTDSEVSFKTLKLSRTSRIKYITEFLFQSQTIFSANIHPPPPLFFPTSHIRTALNHEFIFRHRASASSAFDGDSWSRMFGLWTSLITMKKNQIWFPNLKKTRYFMKKTFFFLSLSFFLKLLARRMFANSFLTFW